MYSKNILIEKKTTKKIRFLKKNKFYLQSKFQYPIFD